MIVNRIGQLSRKIVHVAGTNNHWADILSRVIDRRPVESIKSLMISNLYIKNDITLSHEGLRYDDADYFEMLPRNTNVLAIKCLRDISSDNKSRYLILGYQPSAWNNVKR
ncbi:hypothetical protein GEMRC1_000990 [Eukaryota sp. GEM-RC1]